jgi:hypothetical protein
MAAMRLQPFPRGMKGATSGTEGRSARRQAGRASDCAGADLRIGVHGRLEHSEAIHRLVNRAGFAHGRSPFTEDWLARPILK